MRAAAYEAKKDYDKAHRRSRRGHQARCQATATIICCAASSIATRAISTGRCVEFNEKVKLDPDAAGGYSKRGDLYRLRKEYDLSVADYDQVIKIEPESAKGYIDRGWVVRAQERSRQGRGRFRQGARAAPERSVGAGRPRRGEEPQGPADRRQPPTSRSPSSSSPASSTRSGSSASSNPAM